MTTEEAIEIEVPVDYDNVVENYQQAQGRDWKTFLGEDWLTILEKSKCLDSDSESDSETDECSDKEGDDDAGGESDDDTCRDWLTVLENYSFIESFGSEWETSDSEEEEDEDEDEYSSDCESIEDLACLTDMLLAGEEPPVAHPEDWDSCRASLYTVEDDTIYTSLTKQEVFFEGMPGQFHAEEASTHLNRCAAAYGMKEEDIFARPSKVASKRDILAVTKEASVESQTESQGSEEDHKEITFGGPLESVPKKAQDSAPSKPAAKKKCFELCFNPHELTAAPENAKDTPVKESQQEICFNLSALPVTTKDSQEETKSVASDRSSKKSLQEICFSPYTAVPSAPQEPATPEPTKNLHEVCFNPHKDAQEHCINPDAPEQPATSNYKELCFNPYAPSAAQSPQEATPADASAAPSKPSQKLREELSSLPPKARKRFLRKLIKKIKKATSCLSKAALPGKRKDAMEASHTCSVTTVEETNAFEETSRRMNLPVHVETIPEHIVNS